jgi:hypothetical protein
MSNWFDVVEDYVSNDALRNHLHRAIRTSLGDDFAPDLIHPIEKPSGLLLMLKGEEPFLIRFYDPPPTATITFLGSLAGAVYSETVTKTDSGQQVVTASWRTNVSATTALCAFGTRWKAISAKRLAPSIAPECSAKSFWSGLGKPNDPLLSLSREVQVERDPRAVGRVRLQMAHGDRRAGSTARDRARRRARRLAQAPSAACGAPGGPEPCSTRDGNERGSRPPSRRSRGSHPT